MKLGRTTGYGLLAVAYIAQNKDQGLIQSQDVAKKYNIPLEYLFKILQQLVRARILQSKRGPRGGFSMARPATKITMLDVVEAVEGPMINYLNLAEQARGVKFAAKAEQVYEKAIAQARGIFEKTKLADMLD